MTAPPNSFQTRFGRFYSHPASGVQQADLSDTAIRRHVIDLATGRLPDSDGPYAPKPSITNIIGMMDKAFLPPYYAKLVATYAVSHLDELRYQAETFGDDTAIGTLKSVPSRPNEAAAIGDEVHAAIDAFVSSGGDPGDIELTTKTAQDMYAQFLHFVREYRPNFVRSEYTVWSYEHGYAGTGDLMWRADGRLWVVDTKTGQSVHPEVAMQTAAIASADVILAADGTEHEMPEAGGLAVLHLRPRSARLYELHRTAEALDAFLALKRVFDWRRFDAGQTIGEPLIRTQIKKYPSTLTTPIATP